MAGSAVSSLWEPEASSFHLASTETGFSCVRFWRRGIRQLTYSRKWTNSQKPNRDKKYEPRTVHSQLARMCACVAQWLIGSLPARLKSMSLCGGVWAHVEQRSGKKCRCGGLLFRNRSALGCDFVLKLKIMHGFSCIFRPNTPVTKQVF